MYNVTFKDGLTDKIEVVEQYHMYYDAKRRVAMYNDTLASNGLESCGEYFIQEC